MTDLENRVAIVTGAAGARVAVSDVDVAQGEETVRRVVAEGTEARFIETDVTDPQACEALVAEILETVGRLDVAFNNAGIGGEQNPTAEYSIASWQRVIEINLSSIFYCLKAQIPAMLKNDGYLAP